MNSQPLRTLLFWLGLAATFVAFFVTKIGWVLPVGIVGTVVLLGVLQRLWPVQKDDSTLGIEALNRGRISEARERFDAALVKQPKQPVLLYNRGIARFYLWQLDEALADLALSEKHGGLKQAHLKPLLLEHRALMLAIQGRGDDARAAQQQVPNERRDAQRNGLIEAVLALRAGDASGARAHLAPYEMKLVAGVLGPLLRAIDAMAVERSNGELRHVDRVALFGEAAPDGLRKAWPELVAFVERAPAW